MYIYKGIEVITTGRKADKYDKRRDKIIHTLIEIKPKEPPAHEDAWVEWVALTDLYEIQNISTTQDPILLLEN